MTEPSAPDATRSEQVEATAPAADTASTSHPQVHGTCDPAFAAVREAFEADLASGAELGAAVCVTLDGKTVVDLWGGWEDADRTRPWRRDTVVNVYSATKGPTAACALRLVEDGRLDLDAPIATYWPEFAAAGKEGARVRDAFCHRAGVPALRPAVEEDILYDWDRLIALLAAETPWWEPGALHGYHAFTYGHLLGELVRRVDGRSLGRFWREEIAGPFGFDFQIGLPVVDDVRVADLQMPPPPPPGVPNLIEELMKDPASAGWHAFFNPVAIGPHVNSRAWRAAEIPGGNGHGTARALAGFYGVLAAGGAKGDKHLLAPATIEAATTEQVFGPDAILLGLPTRFGLGFMLSHADAPMGPGARTFGHPGAGGSLGFADPDARLGFGYVTNQMQSGLMIDARATQLFGAAYSAL